MKIAAIDIGSNAARLFIVEVITNKRGVVEFNKVNFVRLPLRLGFDVFDTGEISAPKAEKVVTAMQAFKDVLSYYDVKHLKVCATSAMRDAKNSPEIIHTVEKETGIKINIISGDEEAVLVHENHIAENLDKEHGYLYVNVGGGSTDLIFYVAGQMVYKKSLNIGTIRILKGQITDTHWDQMKSELKTNVKSDLPVVAIGSGGNINKVFALSKRREGKPLTLDILKEYYLDFSTITFEERVHKYNLREDRAEVIVPALQIYINLMRWGHIKDIYVPNIGLVDGLVRALYRELAIS